MSRVSRMGLPLSSVSSTARKRACFCTCRAKAYRNRARTWPGSAAHPGKAARAAATASSTSWGRAWTTVAKVLPVAGFTVGKEAASGGLRHWPLIKRPKPSLCRASHCLTGPSASGAGPYSMVSRMRLISTAFASLSMSPSGPAPA